MTAFIVKSAAQQLGKMLAEEAQYLYKVKDKIKSLQIELAWMECFLRDADTQQHQERVICMWVSQVRDLAYEAEDIVERYLHEVSHHRQDGIRNTLKWFSCILCTCDAYTLHTLGLKIDSLRVKITELTSRLQTYGIQIIKPTESFMYNTMVREERRTYSHFEDEEIVGLQKDVQKVVDQLVNTDVKVVGISGIGGLGKTTLARKVLLDKAIRKHFNNTCVWVYISKQLERDNVFQEILIGLHKDEDAKKKIKDLSIGELPIEICELLQQTKCFVVLDDIWTLDAWESLKPAFASIGNSASKILLTTRNQGLLQHVDFNRYSHCLDPLSDEDSWKLLQLKAFPPKSTEESSSPRNIELQADNDVKTKMEKSGKEMLKHCRGLPLAIIALGGILLSKRSLLEWENVQKNISSYLMSDIGNGGKNGGILQVLELSYHDLPFYLKPCFLYLGNFPEDYEISTEKLYQLWEAEGILATPTKDEIEVGGVTSFEIGEKYLHQLIDRCMVQVGRHWPSGRIRSCRLHDVMRDMCLRKCKEVCFLNVQECTEIDWASVCHVDSVLAKEMRRCAFHVKEGVVYSGRALHGRKAPSLRSLLIFLLNNSRENMRRMVLANIGKSFPMLRVLDLEDKHMTDDAGEIGNLIHLRYLSLRNLLNVRLSSRFWDLKYLVSLDLRCLYVTGLSSKLHQLERLRHLYLPRIYDIKEGDKLSFRAHQMETLKNFHPEKCQMEDLLQMTCLRNFSITGDYTFKRRDVFRVLVDSPVIKSGQLTNTLKIAMAAEVMDEDPTILTFLRGNPCFDKFTLKGNLSIQYHNINSAIAMGTEVFPSSLTRFEFWYFNLSRELSLVLENLPQIEWLKLGDVNTCNKLTFSAGSFKHLKSLYLSWLKDLEECEIGDGALSNLTFLRIYGCHKLKKIPDGLPNSIHIVCENPCINGIENYNTCPHFKPKRARGNQ